MPHIPRQLPGTLSVPPELLQPPQDVHSPIPVNQPESNKRQSNKLGLDQINPHKWEVDPKDVFKALFGKEPTVDEHTGQLVHPWKPQREQPAIFGQT